MPRHTHPTSKPQGHSRAHIRHHRTRTINRRLRMLRDEQLIREPYWFREEPQRVEFADLIEDFANVRLVRDWIGAYRLPNHISALAKTGLDYEGCCDDWDCACGNCWNPRRPHDRATARRGAQREIDEQLGFYRPPQRRGKSIRYRQYKPKLCIWCGVDHSACYNECSLNRYWQGFVSSINDRFSVFVVTVHIYGFDIAFNEYIGQHNYLGVKSKLSYEERDLLWFAVLELYEERYGS